jgi:hypothetical protein
MPWRRVLLAALVGLTALQARADDSPFLIRLASRQPSQPSYAMPRIPLESIEAPLREKVRGVLDKPTVSARGLSETFNTRPEVYRWLLEHPDVAVKMWRQLGAKVADIDDRGGGKYVWTDGQGSEVHWQIVLRAPGKHLWYAEGKVKATLLLPAHDFRAVALMEYTEGVDTRDLPAVRHQVHFVLRCDSRAVTLVARLLGNSVPRLAEQYLGQLQMFYGGLAWYLYQDEERAKKLFGEAGLPAPTQ